MGEHQARLYRIALVICGDPHVAEEAVAEVAARCWEAVASGRLDDPRAYLRRALVNVLHGTFRRRAVERRARERRSGDDRGAVDEVTSLVERDAVLRALQELPERQRAVLVLRFYEGLSEAEIAAEMRMPAGTVKSTASRGVAQMRMLMEEER